MLSHSVSVQTIKFILPESMKEKNTHTHPTDMLSLYKKWNKKKKTNEKKIIICHSFHYFLRCHRYDDEQKKTQICMSQLINILAGKLRHKMSRASKIGLRK